MLWWSPRQLAEAFVRALTREQSALAAALEQLAQATETRFSAVERELQACVGALGGELLDQLGHAGRAMLGSRSPGDSSAVRLLTRSVPWISSADLELAARLPRVPSALRPRAGDQLCRPRGDQ